MVAALDAMGSNQLKLDYLREQIEMRVIGLGFDQFKTNWSSSKDAEIGSVVDLSAHLKEILMEEEELRVEGKLPDAAVVPTMRRKTFKELGTATPQAVELAGQCLELPLDELLKRAETERERLEALGELDSTADVMPKDAPPCNESLIGKELEMIEMGAEAWDALSEAEQVHLCRVHKLDCHNHMRNIFLGPMSKKMSKHVAVELKDHLEAFSSWERMTTEFDQLLRGCYKEFHHGNKYYKGKGREFWVWLKNTYPLDFAMHLERAEGGRQDLDFDAAVPMYILRKRLVEFRLACS